MRETIINLYKSFAESVKNVKLLNHYEWNCEINFFLFRIGNKYYFMMIELG